jgi:hypothetical protein
MDIPEWDECYAKAQRKLDLTPLEEFVYNEEPFAPTDTSWRIGLQRLVDFVQKETLDG